MNFTTLVAGTDTDGSLKNWLNNATLPSATIVAEAEQFIYRRLRVRQMLATATGTATASQTGIPIGDDYLETRSLIWTGTNSGRLQQTIIEDIEASYSYDGTARTTGRPSHYAADGTLLTFNVLPDGDYPYQHVYYATPAALGTATETNFLTTKYPTMLRSACMMLASQFAKTEDQQLWEIRTMTEISHANREDDRRYRDMDLRVMIG